MNPLCNCYSSITIRDWQTKSNKLINSGFSVISDPNINTMQFLNKSDLVDWDSPYYGWLIAIHSIPVKIALNFGINLIFYGEDGEVEYGGSKETHDNYLYDVEYMKKIYLEGGYEKV